MDYDKKIVKILDNLKIQFKNTNYSVEEKEAINLLLDKVKIYYLKQLSTLSKKYNNKTKIMQLQSEVVDILVELNTLLNHNIDAFYFIEEINKIIHDDELDKYIRIHRYIK